MTTPQHCGIENVSICKGIDHLKVGVGIRTLSSSNCEITYEHSLGDRACTLALLPQHIIQFYGQADISVQENKQTLNKH